MRASHTPQTSTSRHGGGRNEYRGHMRFRNLGKVNRVTQQTREKKERAKKITVSGGTATISRLQLPKLPQTDDHVRRTGVNGQNERPVCKDDQESPQRRVLRGGASTLEVKKSDNG